MKYFLPLIIVLLCLSVNSNFEDKAITVKVIFESYENVENFEGIFSIVETEQSTRVTTKKDFTVTLPKKGHYNFNFKAEGFLAYLNFPQTITEKNNIIVIRLVKRLKFSTIDYNLYKSLKDNVVYTQQELDSLWKSNNIKFIIHGISNNSTDRMVHFTKNYNIGFTFENCVVDPLSFKRASSNNKIIHDFLVSKFGTSWKSDLPAKPIGFKI